MSGGGALVGAVVAMSDPEKVSEQWRCSCGAQCPTHGVISLDDRQAAFGAGYEAGVAAGRLQAVRAEVGALSSAAELLDWIQTRTLAFARDGQGWADMVAGDRPGGDRS